MLAIPPRQLDLRGPYEIRLHIKNLQAKLDLQEAERKARSAERLAKLRIEQRIGPFMRGGLYYGPPMPVTFGRKDER